MSDYPDYQALRSEVDDLKRSVQVLERGERFENLEKFIEANTRAIQVMASSTQHLLSEQNRKVEALETNLRADMGKLRDDVGADVNKLETNLQADMNGLETSLHGDMDKLETNLRADMRSLDTKLETFRSDLESKINHSQTVILGAIGAVGVVLVVVQFLVTRGG